ncbi:UNVERIFIED_CONTAM: hypothetical protein GTU68_049687 [Idotea baltica]|nr:hypothetical protein [Idotea baltica]
MRTTIDKRIKASLNAQYVEESTSLIDKTVTQLNQYFNKELIKFSIDLYFAGTAFQQQVWQALINIPYGETSTYLKLAQSLKNEKAIRAIASANGANAISIIIPCHRIIGSDGSLVGYAGGLPVKKKLLQLEGSWDKNEQLNLFATKKG